MTAAPTLSLPGRKSITSYTLPADLTFAEYLRVRNTCELLVASSRWWLVDAVAYGLEHFPAEYDASLPTATSDPTGASLSRLKQARWMASIFPPSTRVPGLSYSHHRTVAGLEPDERATLLREALSGGLSTRALGDLVKSRQGAPAEPEPTPETPPAYAPIVPLHRPIQQATSGPLAVAQPWQPRQPTYREIVRGADPVRAGEPDEDQLIAGALAALEAWARTFAPHRGRQRFEAALGHVFDAIHEAGAPERLAV